MKKNILITAGPVFVRLDDVRVISNISTGETGCLIAEHFSKKSKVTLLLGPGQSFPEKHNSLTVKKFVYFEELRKLFHSELLKHKYRAVIHTAAVSDYQPIKGRKGKIPSGKKKMTVVLKPLPKIIKDVKRINKGIFLVQFKLESGLNEDKLIEKALKSMEENKADLVVANDLYRIKGNKHLFYILSRDKETHKAGTKKELAEKLEAIFKKGNII